MGYLRYIADGRGRSDAISPEALAMKITTAMTTSRPFKVKTYARLS
jgi:hypothetical protein